MAGESGVGKTRAWRVLLQALARLESCDGVAHVLDPKVLSKEALYGTLDATTRAKQLGEIDAKLAALKL